MGGLLFVDIFFVCVGILANVSGITDAAAATGEHVALVSFVEGPVFPAGEYGGQVALVLNGNGDKVGIVPGFSSSFYLGDSISAEAFATLTWQNVPVGPSYDYITSFTASSDFLNMFVDGNNIGLYSFDGGSNWQSSNMPSYLGFSLAASSLTNEYILAGYEDNMYLSTDYGKNFVSVTSQEEGYSVMSAAISYTGQTLVLGLFDTVITSIDNGNSWSTGSGLPPSDGGGYTHLLVSDTLILAAEYLGTTIYVSRDRGQSYSPITFTGYFSILTMTASFNLSQILVYNWDSLSFYASSNYAQSFSAVVVDPSAQAQLTQLAQTYGTLTTFAVSRTNASVLIATNSGTSVYRGELVWGNASEIAQVPTPSPVTVPVPTLAPSTPSTAVTTFPSTLISPTMIPSARILPPTSSSSNSSSGGTIGVMGISVGGFAGVIVGGVVVLALCIAAALWLLFPRHEEQSKSTKIAPPVPDDGSFSVGQSPFHNAL